MAGKEELLKRKKEISDKKLDEITLHIANSNTITTSKNKDRRVTLLLDEDTFSRLKDKADQMHISKNAYLNMILSKALDSE